MKNRRGAIFTWILVGLGCSGPLALDESTPPPPEPSFESLIADLRDPDGDVREIAAAQLGRLRPQALDLRTRLKALTEASRSFPERITGRNTRVDLAKLAARYPDEAYLPLLDVLVGEYDDDTSHALLEMLASMPSQHAARTYARFLNTYAKREVPGHWRKLPVGSLLVEPRHPDLLLPAFLDRMTDPQLGWTSRQIVLRLCRTFPESIRLLTPRVPEMLEAYGEHAEVLQPLQKKAQGDFRYQDQRYVYHRNEASLWLDLFGCLTPKQGRRVLRRALRFRDPRLRYFAAASLLRTGRRVPRSTLIQIAEHLEVRAWLIPQLARLGRLAAIPRRLKSQQAVAESRLAQWLLYESSAGFLPDRLTLDARVEMRSSEDEDGSEDFAAYYVFRFEAVRKDGSEDWFAGVAGPYDPDPDALSGGDATGSYFIRADTLSPEDHVRTVLNPD